MALDVYVMPLWRFKTGDFSTPIEEGLGLEPTIITSDGVVRPSQRRSRDWTSLLRRFRARRETRAIRKAVESANLVRVRWNDDGPVQYSQQSPGFEALRAYARWLDCRDRIPRFDAPPERDYYKHPVMKEQISNPGCPHLVGHSCFSGYYLPVDFEKVVQVEPYLILGYYPATHAVGSSPRLMKELDRIQVDLQAPADQRLDASDPLVDVKVAYLQLRDIAELSCRHGLPVIFHG
ncbi:hypothetical protein Pan44_44700 [Caulifigura coniformis]|uniref:Uncharacterized protein n=1 Tax=Caulifigura coniformis TaxID=2527983 RepID=A0A517SJX5_9PLAN|nr:hypothetical protein [Caulifigura coniformis]QDT56416.1 hypothetical protein Pan44_44700 [Caulifigura coniformis]